MRGCCIGPAISRRSVRQYKKAVESDPSVADAELAARLGIQTDQTRETVDDVVDGKVRAAWEDPGGSELVDVERPSIKFKDVGGLEDLKEEIRMKIIHPLKHPELYKAYGKAIGGGILMYGPPGCGKTLSGPRHGRRNQAPFHQRGHQ